MKTWHADYTIYPVRRCDVCGEDRPMRDTNLALICTGCDTPYRREPA